MNEIITYSDNIKKLTTEIKVIQDNVCQGMIEIGKRLIEIKNEVGHGNWLPYLKDELGYSDRTAQNLMRVAIEFSNTKSISDLPSTKIFELLTLAQEYREDFLESTDLENTTVRELKAEIQKYKEANDLLTERQKEALERKRLAEQEKASVEAELQREKSKSPKVETKIVEKVVEKVIDKTDSSLANKLINCENKIKYLTDKIKVLEEGEEINMELVANCKKEVEEYKQFKGRLLGMQSVTGGDYDEVETLKDIDELYLRIDDLIKRDLSPVRYSSCMRFINRSTYINDSFNTLIDTVQQWCDDMRKELDKNNNIINVEGF